MAFILAIDDDADRYDGLRRYLDSRPDVTVHVVACVACVAELLPRADVVLLDYDLDSGELCPGCRDVIRERWKGIHYVGDIADAGKSVVVTSCSSEENVRRLVTDLHRRGVRTAQHAAFETDCELRWLGRLVTWGIL